MQLTPLQVYKLTQKGKELVYRGDSSNVVSCIYSHEHYDEYYKLNYHHFIIISKFEHPDGKFYYNSDSIRISE